MPGDTPNCGSCGDNDETVENPNLSCGNGGTNVGCDNPCGRGPHNSAKCESLPSQIQNFTDQFFGTVVKTEVNGVVSWSLPCGLDIGLPANPRGIGEGLACYFLRLFENGIVGLKGDPGTPGAAGAQGFNAYTVVLHSFTQPTLASPNVQVSTPFNPALSLNSLYVFIDTSGWYQINGSDGNGTLFLTLIQPLSGAPATIAAGKLVLPAGTPGKTVTGPQGIQGPVGPQGPPGQTFTTENSVYTAPVGVDFNLPIVAAAVNFTNSSPQFVAPEAGQYLVTVTAIVKGNSGILSTDTVSLKLRNTSLFADVPGALQTISGVAVGQQLQITLSTIATTTGPNQVIALWGSCSTDVKAAVLHSLTTLSWMRIA